MTREWHSLISNPQDLPPVGVGNWVEVTVEDTRGREVRRFVCKAFLPSSDRDKHWYEYTVFSPRREIEVKGVSVVAWRDRPAPVLPYTGEWK